MWFINLFVFMGEETPLLALAGAGQVRRQRRAAEVQAAEVQAAYWSWRQAAGGTEMLVEAGTGCAEHG